MLLAASYWDPALVGSKEPCATPDSWSALPLHRSRAQRDGAETVSLRDHTSLPPQPRCSTINQDDVVATLVALVSLVPDQPPILVAHSFGYLHAKRLLMLHGSTLSTR